MTPVEIHQAEIDMLSMNEVAKHGKELSISADLGTSFILSFVSTVLSLPMTLCEKRSFFQLTECTLVLQTIPIRASKEQAHVRGLFGCGDEPSKLVDLTDVEALGPYLELYRDL